MHLRLDLLFEHDLAALENLLNMRTQLARLRIDNRELLFDAQGERVFLGTHGGLQMSSKTQRLSSRASHFDKQDACRPRQAGSLSSDVAERTACDGRLHEFPPAKVVAASNVLSRFPNRHFRNCFYHPLEVFLTHGGYFRVWRRIAKIDRHRHAVAHSELDGVQIVAEKFV